MRKLIHIMAASLSPLETMTMSKQSDFMPGNVERKKKMYNREAIEKRGKEINIIIDVKLSYRINIVLVSGVCVLYTRTRPVPEISVIGRVKSVYDIFLRMCLL